MRNRHWLVISLLLLGILVLAFVLNGVIRETIAPALLAWVWRVSLMSSGFPQVIIWAFFIALIPIMALFSLIHTVAYPDPEPIGGTKQHDGRVQAWSRQLGRIHEGDYFRSQAIRELANLALDTLAYEERLTRDETREKLRNEQLDISDEVRHFLQAGLRSSRIQSSRVTGKHPSERQVAWLDPEIDNIIQFLEVALEVEGED